MAKVLLVDRIATEQECGNEVSDLGEAGALFVL
jgi:hypothetical protein